MSKVFIEESTLTAIGDAIRGKTGSTELIAPLDMPSEITGIVSGSDPIVEALEVTSNGTYTAPDGIDGYTPVVVNVPQDGAPTAEDLTFTGDCQYLFYGGGWDWVLRKYMGLMSFTNISSFSYGFYDSQMEDLSGLTINFGDNGSTSDYLFGYCNWLVKLPKINGKLLNSFAGMFQGAENLPSGEVNNFFENLSIMSKDSFTYSFSAMFTTAFSLRNINSALQTIHNWFVTNGVSTSPAYSNMFQYCRTLDELNNVPFAAKANYTSNRFSGTFQGLNRCKDIRFATQEDGSPYVVNWRSQTVDLSSYVGYGDSQIDYYIIPYNSGITVDKKVTDDASYQALKNDPDWYTSNIAYSRYNHDSAVNTINSLPDASAYGTNTIKFKGASGSSTDGGAINTLTEAEIAVAAAKGWTCSFV